MLSLKQPGKDAQDQSLIGKVSELALDLLAVTHKKNFRIIGEPKTNTVFGTALLIVEDSEFIRTVVRIYSPFLTLKGETRTNILERQKKWFEEEATISTQAGLAGIKTLPFKILSKEVKIDNGEQGVIELKINQLSYVAGETIDEIKNFSDKDIKNILSNSYSALQFLHSIGKRHGDLLFNISYDKESGAGGIFDLVTVKTVIGLQHETEFTVFAKPNEYFHDVNMALGSQDNSATFKADVVSVARCVVMAVLDERAKGILKEAIIEARRDLAQVWRHEKINLALRENGLSEEISNLICELAGKDPTLDTVKCLDAREALERVKGLGNIEISLPLAEKKLESSMIIKAERNIRSAEEKRESVLENNKEIQEIREYINARRRAKASFGTFLASSVSAVVLYGPNTTPSGLMFLGIVASVMYLFVNSINRSETPQAIKDERIKAKKTLKSIRKESKEVIRWMPLPSKKEFALSDPWLFEQKNKFFIEQFVVSNQGIKLKRFEISLEQAKAYQDGRFEVPSDSAFSYKRVSLFDVVKYQKLCSSSWISSFEGKATSAYKISLMRKATNNLPKVDPTKRILQS